MKRAAALLIAVCLLLLAGFAVAEQPVERSGALAAYVDGLGGLFLPGNQKAINTAPADKLISIDPYRVLFTSRQADGTDDLYMIDLGGFAETRLARGVHAAVMADEDTLYYVPAASRAQLWRMSMNDMTPRLAYTAAEPIDRLVNTAEGVVFDQVDGMGAMVYAARTDSFERYARALPAATLLTDAYELILSDGELTLKSAASLTEEIIDTGVIDFAVLDGNVYYLANTGSATRLKGYDPAAMTWQVVLTLEPDVDRQLTASAEKLFMHKGAELYTVNLQTRTLDVFQQLGGAIPQLDGYTFEGYRLYGMDGQLNVYAEYSEGAPDFSFIEFTSASDSQANVSRLVTTYPLDGEEPAWTYLKPAKQYSPLARGSRGQAVSAIQQPLYDLGYYDYYIDGIFGPRTQYAVELLQADLNRPVNGVADSELQRMLIEGTLPHYDAYMALTRGNRGMRVQIMQERLRELGYLADAADGIFGSNTQRAVQLFQSENGLNVSDGATRETLKLLYSDGAQRCMSYIDLYRGYTGYRVRELNNRLEALYYLEDNPGSSYTAATAEAVRAFQRSAGLSVDGNATARVQRRLFSAYAPEAPGYITLRRGDENTRVAELQRRLKQLNYFSGAITGYYGASTEKAVILFQRQSGLNDTGIANVRTQTLLYRRDAPAYVAPTVIGAPVISVKPYAYIEKNIYCITDDTSDTGYITFSWYAEGDVESYHVRIQDGDGHTVFDEDTLLSRTGVSLWTLDYDDPYTMTVTAYPEDGNSRHVTSAKLRFMRVDIPEEPVEPPIGDVETPEITLEPVTRVQDGIQFVAPGKVIFGWHADGEVDSYYVEVLDSDGDTVMSLNTRDEQATVKTDDLLVGEVYTLFVYAIPTNGTLEDAAVNAEQFALEDASIPTPSPEPPEDVPLMQPDEAPATPAPEEDEVEATPTPEPVPEATPVPTPEPTPVPEVTPEPEQPERPEQQEPEQPEQQEQSEAEQPESEPEQPEPEKVLAEPQPVITLEPQVAAPDAPVPELSFETVVDEEDGVTFLANDTVRLMWQADGAIGYEVNVTNGNGDVVAHAVTDKTALSVKPENLIPGEVYTLNVAPILVDAADWEAAASARFALAPAKAEAPDEVPVVQEAPEEEAPDETEEVPDESAEEAPKAEPQEDYDEEDYAEETDAEESYEEESYDEQPYVEESYAEEAFEKKPAAQEAYDEEPYVEEDAAADEAEEEVYEDEDVYVEGDIDAAEAEESDDADAPLTVTAESDPDLIARLQDRLTGWGWLEADTFERGELDSATLQAVRDFQAWYNDAYGEALPQAAASVDAATTALLLNQDGDVYAK